MVDPRFALGVLFLRLFFVLARTRRPTAGNVYLKPKRRHQRSDLSVESEILIVGEQRAVMTVG